MSHYFNRLCRVIIQGEKEIDIRDNKISFEVTKSSNAKENISRIEIWNLATKTRKLITATDSMVRLFAGYADNRGLIEICQGDITNVRHNRNTTDTITQIYTEDGNKRLRLNLISESFKGTVYLKNILSRLTEKTGVAFRLVGVSNSSVGGGYAIVGGFDLALDGLAQVFGFSWSTQGGIILLRGKEDIGDTEVMLLSAETGLILNPQTVKQVSERLVDSDEPLSLNVYALQSLLQPNLQINDLVAVKSRDLNGNFRINKISHTGDTRGNNWYSNMEVVAA